MIGVTVSDDVFDPAHQHGGFAATRACQDQKRSFGLKYGSSLLGIQISVNLIKQSALGGYVSFFQL